MTLSRPRSAHPVMHAGRAERTLGEFRAVPSPPSFTEDAMAWLPPSHAHTPDSGMGHFRVAVEVANRAGERFQPMEALVDTGATYTWIPRDVLGGLGAEPEEEWPFVLADGREVRYPVAWVQIGIG